MSTALDVKRDLYSFGLIGFPLGHSLSPQIHAAALQALGLNGEYKLLPVPPSPSPRGRGNGAEGKTLYKLENVLEQLRAGELRGLNATIPHKQSVIPLLDALTPTAKAVGAVNTIFRDGELLVGDNTDAPGFWADVQQLVKSREREADHHALILGAGGSARAVAYALLTNGYFVTIAARKSEKAHQLTDQYSVFRGQLAASDMNDWPASISHSSLIVNATPVGMFPHVDHSPWPEGVPFPEHASVYDLVYNPRETLLTRQARAAGLPATTGLGMLVEQAALAFKRWTGLEASREVMMKAVEGQP